MPSDGQAKPERGIAVSSRWGWGPSANEEKLICFGIPPLNVEIVREMLDDPHA